MPTENSSYSFASSLVSCLHVSFSPTTGFQTFLKCDDHEHGLDGGGRHITSEEIEENLLEWIFDRRIKGLRVSRKIIMVKAAKFQEEKEKEDPNITKLTFSQGWLEKFVNRNGLSVRRHTTEAQKSPDQLIDKLCAYILKIRRLRMMMNYELKNTFARDETAVWNDMISNTTVEKRGAHSVNLKSTGREKSKITVCLNATADGGKKSLSLCLR